MDSKSPPTGQSALPPAPAVQVGLVLSGGGSRSAFQIGALRALVPYIEQKGHISVIVGSSVGAINGIVIGSWLRSGLPSALERIESVWLERNFKNTFDGSPSRAFLRAIQVAVMQYVAPGPKSTDRAIFNPRPLMTAVDQLMEEGGGLEPETREKHLRAVAVMTTIDGPERRGLLFVSAQDGVVFHDSAGIAFDVCLLRKMNASHAFASAALPSVLPPVTLNLDTRQVRLVDGGISDNIPVDPACRLGATDLIVIDNSGRRWWLDRVGKPHDTREPWEIAYKDGDFCVRPNSYLEVRNTLGFGPLLKEAVGRSTRDFVAALGPVWPIFKILRGKLGEEVAYEAVSYCALHPDYMSAVIQRGYEEALGVITKLASESAERHAQSIP
ncbi:MAG: patatin-like phospholipase family protein [Deltaproteobacteria bacterium]|nr:patatin-like phospholipase family protein [Deltaproteobacteria bacterium]